MYNIILGLTSIPGREKDITFCLDSILKQTLLPNKIILTICENYKRDFGGGKYYTGHLDKYKANSIFEINYSKIDYGPATKLLGVIDRVDTFEKDTFIILVDDDLIYNPNMLKIFHDNILKNPNQAYSFCTYHNKMNNCMIGQGADGFAMNASILSEFKKFYFNCVDYNKKLFYHDDLIISKYLSNKGHDIMFLSIGTLIYTETSSSKSLNSLHKLGGDLNNYKLNQIIIPEFNI